MVNMCFIIGTNFNSTHVYTTTKKCNNINLEKKIILKCFDYSWFHNSSCRFFNKKISKLEVI